MKIKYETPLAFALACLLLSGAAVLAAGLDEIFNLEPTARYAHWEDLEAEPGPGLPAEPTWPRASLPEPNPAALLLAPPQLFGGGAGGFLAPAPPDGAPPWPESGPLGWTLDGLLFPVEDAPPASPLGI
ncbi:MAG: hypothetical protein LDL11_04800 [Desulfarculus sp.]|nr:hypothetical protein [Desulfarculus sp.]